MNKKYIVNTTDFSQFFPSAHSLKKICVERRWFKFIIINEDEKTKDKIIPRMLVYQSKNAFEVHVLFVLKKNPEQPPTKPLSRQNSDTFKVLYGFHFMCQVGSPYS